MKDSLFITLFLVLAGVLNAGLTFPIDPDTVGPITVSSFSGFFGDVCTSEFCDFGIPSGELTDAEWADIDAIETPNVDFVFPEGFFDTIPDELVAIIMSLFTPGQVVLPEEPVDMPIPVPEVPEPASCLLLAAGCLMLRRRR